MVHETKIRVRYGETDQMGYVYYGNYALYYEIGRVEMLRDLGISYKDLEEVYNIILPVAKMEIKYIRPARYDEMLRVQTSMLKSPDKFIHFETKIFNEQDELLNLSKVTLCFVDKNTQKPTICPTFLLEKLEPIHE